MSDPVNTARARIAYYSRPGVGDPDKLAQYRREFVIAKMERYLRENLQNVVPLNEEERDRLSSLLSA